MYLMLFFFSSRRRLTRCAFVTGVQTCALPIFGPALFRRRIGFPELFRHAVALALGLARTDHDLVARAFGARIIAVNDHRDAPLAVGSGAKSAFRRALRLRERRSGKGGGNKQGRQDRTRVVLGKGGSGRVDYGG